MDRQIVKYGIPELDKMLKGGLTKGCITVLSGPTGCGKSTLAMEFLIKGIEKYSETGLYIALEETRATTLSNMAGYRWDITKYERDKKFYFLDYPIHEVDQFLFKNSAIEELIHTTGVERVVIDSIMPIALLFSNDDERQKGFLKLIENLRKWGTTTLLVSEDTPVISVNSLPHTKYKIESLADGWIHLYYFFDKENARKRALEIIKMKGIEHINKKVPFEISENGVTLKL